MRECRVIKMREYSNLWNRRHNSSPLWSDLMKHVIWCLNSSKFLVNILAKSCDFLSKHHTQKHFHVWIWPCPYFHSSWLFCCILFCFVVVSTSRKCIKQPVFGVRFKHTAERCSQRYITPTSSFINPYSSACSQLSGRLLLLTLMSSSTDY